LYTGDLCSDTNPTTRNKRCSDPLPSDDEDTCGQTRFEDTPYNNYMGYAGNDLFDIIVMMLWFMIYDTLFYRIKY